VLVKRATAKKKHLQNSHQKLFARFLIFFFFGEKICYFFEVDFNFWADLGDCLVKRCVIFQIETSGVLNGYLVFSEHVMMNIKNIGCVYHPRRLASKFQVLSIYKVKLKELIVTQ
jgi:hypothetical protein